MLSVVYITRPTLRSLVTFLYSLLLFYVISGILYLCYINITDAIPYKTVIKHMTNGRIPINFYYTM